VAPLHGAASAAWASIALLVVPWVGLGGWPLWAARSKGNGARADYRLVVTARSTGIGLGAGLAALAAASGVALVTEKVIGHPFTSAVGTVATSTTRAAPVAVILLAVLAAFGSPVVEELAFRGLTYGSFRKLGTGPAAAIGWTALMFAAFHLEPVRLPLLFVIGVALGVARWLADSTWAAIVAHATVNVPGAVELARLAQHH